MLIIKWLHIVFMVTWFAGLFYLPRLFVYHAQAEDKISKDRFVIMERKLYFGIMMPGAVFTLVFGVWLWLGFGFKGGWIMAKLLLVLVILAYHIWCGKIWLDFKKDQNKHSHIFYRWFNEFPVLILFAIVYLVVLKPF